MSETNAGYENILIGQRIQQKYEFYFLGLIFTLLALAVQTPKPETIIICRISEILAWISLLISGLAGLNRIEWTPSLYGLKGLIQGKEYKIEQIRLNTLKTSGPILDTGSGDYIKPEVAIKKLEEAKNRLEEQLEPIQQKVAGRYGIMKYGFIVGLMLLIVSRGLPSIMSIIG